MEWKQGFWNVIELLGGSVSQVRMSRLSLRRFACGPYFYSNFLQQRTRSK